MNKLKVLYGMHRKLSMARYNLMIHVQDVEREIEELENKLIGITNDIDELEKNQ